VTPALEPVEQATAAVQATPAVPANTGTARPESALLDPESALSARAMAAQRASRAALRRVAGVRPAVTPASRGPARASVRVMRDLVVPIVEGTVTPADDTERATRSSYRVIDRAPARRAHSNRVSSGNRSARSVRIRTARATHRPSRHARAVVTKHARVKYDERVMQLGDMTAVIKYAKSQVGRSYIRGGEGSGGFDCSGLTKAAYARAGIDLPHSSGAQAARARGISRSRARAGDLVVGNGHVGIYMGNGMMIDAGNRRTGVVYRKLYSGLRVERF